MDRPDDSVGTFPFGQPVRRLVQQDRSPKRVFVLGVYASAVHARWVGPDGRQKVAALAVASEPVIFWNGSAADEIVNTIKIPSPAGKLVAAGTNLNGPSGRALDNDILKPLGVTRKDAWLCDLVPHACRNPKQEQALAREYEPLRDQLRLPTVTLPPVPPSFADERRREEILHEVRESKADVVVLLGDEPIKWWLKSFASKWGTLGDFGRAADSYGRLHEVTLDGQLVQVLPLVHVRQAARLGSHSPEWARLHDGWKENVATGLLR